MWIKPGGCVTPKSEAIWRTEWTEARVRDWSWIAVLLFGGESDSMSLPEDEESEHAEDDEEWWW